MSAKPVWGTFIVAVLLFVGALFFPWRSYYWTRALVWNDVSITDYEIFPEGVLETKAPNYMFEAASVTLEGSTSPEEFANYFEETGTTGLAEFLTATNTTGFVVLQDGKLVYEGYFNGYERESVNTSFSIAKSFASALIGFAIDDGFIESVQDPIAAYIPELKDDDYDAIQIQDLLSMASGIKYSGDHSPWADAARAYYEPDLRKFALSIVPKESPGQTWQYNNFHPLLIGMILERATGETVTSYLERKIWQPLGMEFGGSWSLDNVGFEKMESGINARTIDFAKFGQLFLQDGTWQGEQILSSSWVRESTRLFDYDNDIQRAAQPGHPMSEHLMGYKYFWWINPRADGVDDYYAAGNLGQYIYISPSRRTVIVRNGKNWGEFDRWVDFLADLSDLVSEENR